MNRRLRMGSLALWVVAAVALSGCGKAADESSPRQVSASASVSPDTIGPPDSIAMENERVSRMTDAVTRVAGTDWATELGGQHWDAQAQELVIYVVNSSRADPLQSSIDKAVRAVQGDYTHRFVRVDRSYEELRTLAVAVMSERQQWAGGYASEVVGIAPDRATNGLNVMATGHVAELKKLLTARVGAVPVAAEQGARLTALKQPLPELTHHRGGGVSVTTDPQGHQVTDEVSTVLVDYPEINGGVHWQREARRVEVFLAPPTDGKTDTRRKARSAVEAISRELPEGVSIAFVDVPYSFKRQGELLDEVSRTRVTWAGPELAPNIVHLNIDSRSGTILIGATDRVSDVRTRARHAFGDRAKVFQATQDVDILQSRQTDSTSPTASIRTS